ncbi:MAG TPA: tryptophan synthase subunit alpha [Bacteroidota bacterium]
MERINHLTISTIQPIATPTLNRINNTFSNLRRAGKKALIPYLTPDFPFKGSTVPLLRSVSAAGADLIEVGIPFSDPLADGKTIQHSSEVALRNGANLASILTSLREFRTSSEVPVLLMGYLNPLLRFGLEKFTVAAVAAGVDGVIIPDLPPEESGSLVESCKTAGLSNVFLIAPTTNDERIRLIDTFSTDFSYCVSVTGVTGARSSLGTNGSSDAFFQRVRRETKKPFVVGFGVSSRDHVADIWRHADGAVVGSALIDRIGRAKSIDEAATAAASFLNSIRPDHA